ncbi:gamma-glutamylcyclotransferase family protein [Thalassoroseus pseudoceratinae]|uniref:gamma-glutamylcyclotransferase family protein n=1 Tax=Thalassoroseus pseudoceratinae TaxID=2713176 RepID=UPI001420ADEB|nr:gamma-glutamylcyclotransferase family protein [Thalassoroseus pseudoceratinae]
MSNLIFCYGSNMCIERLTARIGETERLGCARLRGYVFRMHKRGYDGSAKADAMWTGREGDFMWGVVRRVSGLSKSELDRCEGVGVGYDCSTAKVELSDGAIQTVNLYTARPDWTVPRLTAFCWYREYIIRGAAQHDLPVEYQRQLADIPYTADPDAARRSENWMILQSPA